MRRYISIASTSELLIHKISNIMKKHVRAAEPGYLGYKEIKLGN